MSVDDESAVGQAETARNDAGPPAPPGAGPQGGQRRPRLLWLGGCLVAGFLLFLCYLRFSGSVPVTADGGLSSIQAWDMLHGNWLLKGWALGDVTYYTTELPEYVLVEKLHGLSQEDVHICGAITYTLIVVLAGLLAKSTKTGKQGLVRALIAAGIMIAPQVGQGAGVLLEEPDHIGTAVPLLLTFLLLDRAPRRWWVPPAAGLMLVWAQIGDRTVVTMGVLPILVVCLALVYRGVVQRREPLADHWFNAAVAASAAVSAIVADAIVKIIGHLGGYTVAPLNSALAPTGAWPANVTIVVDGVLRLFGASFNTGPLGVGTLLAAVHLVGLALAVWAFCIVVRRFFRCDDLIAQILTVAIVVQLVAYGISTLPYAGYQDHEIACVLPFGAVLAGRLLAERLTAARLLPALGVVAIGYLAALAFGVVQPQLPAHDQALAPWLRAHHLTAGFSDYSDAAAIELASGNTITMVVPAFHRDYVSRGILFEEQASDFDPLLHDANFVVSTRQYGPAGYIHPGWVIRAFGKPAHTYHFLDWTILVWNQNLLTALRAGPPLPPLPPVPSAPTEGTVPTPPFVLHPSL
jgi:hypothetical protein